MYGALDFTLDLIDSVITEFETIQDAGDAKWIKNELEVMFIKKLLNYLTNTYMSSVESIIDPYLKVARSFQHIGKIIYYDNNDSLPQVHVDDIPDNG
jgi:hypothetical protein